MKIKTQDLTGIALDWAVQAIEQDCEDYDRAAPTFVDWAAWRFKEYHSDGEMHYSTDWSRGGPIIERAEITIQQSPERDCWMAHKNRPASEGPTPLIAAMRSYVVSKLGNTIDIPEELL